MHIFSWQSGKLVLPGLGGRARYASFLHDGAEVGLAEVDADGNLPHLQAAGPPGALVLDLPARRPDVLVPVVELVLTR